MKKIDIALTRFMGTLLLIQSWTSVDWSWKIPLTLASMFAFILAEIKESK